MNQRTSNPWRSKSMIFIEGAPIEGAPTAEALSARIDAAVHRQMKDQEIPGLSLAVGLDDSITNYFPEVTPGANPVKNW